MHIHFVEPRKRTNPLAEQAVESLQRANEGLESAVALVNKLLDNLVRVRAELARLCRSSMKPDPQVAELERMRLQKNTPQKNV
jgi:capsule polysaccharide export protein KpsE/RkpR